jgi:CxxC motif-containing protein (DUF1111 family)
MYEQAFLVVCYKLGASYHTGQWSPGYRLQCLASSRAARNHSAWNIGRTLEQLDGHVLYMQGGPFRNAVACILRSMRKHRFSL